MIPATVATTPPGDSGVDRATRRRRHRRRRIRRIESGDSSRIVSTLATRTIPRTTAARRAAPHLGAAVFISRDYRDARHPNRFRSSPISAPSRRADLASRSASSRSNCPPQRVVATMPVDQRTRQPFGILHGGASAALAETVASLGATANVERRAVRGGRARDQRQPPACEVGRRRHRNRDADPRRSHDARVGRSDRRRARPCQCACPAAHWRFVRAARRGSYRGRDVSQRCGGVSACCSTNSFAS